MSRFTGLLLAAISLLFAVSTVPAFAQPISGDETVDAPLATHSVFVEALGNGGLYSVNYDHRFHEDLSLRGGFSFYSGVDATYGAQVSVLVVPITLNYLAGGPNHNLEMGVGPLLAAGSVSDTDVGPVAGGGLAGVTSTFGYRYQPAGGGLVFRIGLVPFYSAQEIQLWGGISLGYAF
jgi:hypothetical protein